MALVQDPIGTQLMGGGGLLILLALGGGLFAFLDVKRPGIDPRDVTTVMRLWTGVLAIGVVILFCGALRKDWVNRDHWMSRASSLMDNGG